MITKQYLSLVSVLLEKQKRKHSRNGYTLSIHGTTLAYNMQANGFPILRCRKIYYDKIWGELAALCRGPEHISDFKKWGCNYWDQFADEDGRILLDYGYNWWPQLHAMRELFAKDLYTRRAMIVSWRPSMQRYLNLPSCHYSYQFLYNPETECLDLIWVQRSCDIMVGLPSDLVLAGTMLICVATLVSITRGKEIGPGKIFMQIGDLHIYEEHIPEAIRLVENCRELHTDIVRWKVCNPLLTLSLFQPSDLELINYEPVTHTPPIKFECFK